MKIRNDDRLAYREGRIQDIEPSILEQLKIEEAKPEPKKASYQEVKKEIAISEEE